MSANDLEDNPFGILFGPGVLDAPEVYWQSFLGALLRYRDDEGRPLGEGTAPKRYREHVPMEMRTCPYAGTRHHHPLPMNVSSLRQVTDHWKAVVGGTAVLRDRYLAFVAPPTLPLSLSSFWKVSRLGLMLPAYLLRRARDPHRDGTIPAMTAVIYKIMLGVNRIAERQTLIAYSSDLYDRITVEDPSVLYAFTERNQLFVGRHSVCAGTPAMADEIFQTLLSGRPSIDADRTAMESLLDDNALEYFNLLMRLDTEKAAFNVETTFLAHDLLRAMRGATPPAPGPLVTALEDLVRRTDAVSPLSLEIANAPRPVRDRIVEGAHRLCDELEQELERICGRGTGLTRARLEPAHRERTAQGLTQTLRTAHGWEGPQVGEFAGVLVDYFALERSAVVTFQRLQDRIDRALGQPPGPRLDGQDVAAIYGAKLRDLVAAPLGGTVASDGQRTTLTLGNHDLEL